MPLQRKQTKPKRIRDLAVKVEGDPKAFFEKARADVAKASRGFPAPLEIVACVEAAATKPFDEGRKFERERFAFLVEGKESKALRHMFFAERQTSKIPDVPEDTPVRPIKSAAVIGAGTMGGGIAMNFANAGIPVSIMDMTQDAVDKGIAKIKANYASTVSKGRLKQEEMDKCMALIKPVTKLEDGKDADIVIEAVFERMDVKQDMFRKLDAVMKPGAILATNTSTLDVNAIANVTKRPQDVIGTHFFSPANVMRLLEVVRGAKTAKDVLATTMKLGKTIKKVPVVSGVCDGFIGNRMVEKYGQQSLFLIDEGCSARSRWTRPPTSGAWRWGRWRWATWRAWTSAGRSASAATSSGRTSSTRRSATRSPSSAATARRPARAGTSTTCPTASRFRIRKSKKSLPTTEKKTTSRPRQISDEEIVERLIYALVNEAAYILEEGIALRASDIDMVYLTGYGFPAYRGGPMFYADTVGLAKVLASIEKFARATGRGVEARAAAREARKRRKNIQ